MLALAVIGLGVGPVARPAHGAVLSFDSDANAANGVTDGPGVWDTATANWYNASGGPDQVWGNGAADTAVYGAGGTGGAVTVGTVNAGAIVFNTSGYTLAGGTINLSTGSAAGLITVAAGQTATINSALVDGNSSGLNVNGGSTASTYTTGTLTLGGNFSQANLTLLAGGLNLVGSSGNTFTLGNAFNIGGATTDAVTSNMSGPQTFAMPYLEVGTNSDAGGSATLNISGGATVNVSAELFIARTATDTGTINLTNAVMTVPATATKLPEVGQNGTAFFNVSGTSAFTDSSTAVVEVGSASSAAGTINLGGSATFTAAGIVRVGDSGVGTVNVQGGTFNASAGLVLANATSGVGTVNLTGGTLYALSVTKGAGTAANAAVFNFSGGTLATLPASPTGFMAGLTAAYVNAGGATIDTTNAGVTIAQPLLAPAGGGTGGGLTKLGPNTLTLSGNNTYTGATNIAGGTLTLSGTGPRLSAGPLNVAAGATLFVNGAPGTGGAYPLSFADLTGGGTIDEVSTYTPGETDTLTVGSDNTSTTFGGTIAGGAGTTSTPIALALTKVGTGTLTLSGPNTYAGATTVSAGTLRVNGSTLNTGTVSVAAGATLGGNGSVGAVTVGGTITAGPDAATVGNLSTGMQTWTTGGTFLAKFAGDNSTNDVLVMTGLNYAGGGFNVNLSGGSVSSASGTFVLAVDKGATGDPFVKSSLTLTINGLAAPAGDTLGEQPDTLVAGGGVDLILEATAAAPEPTSLLLLGIAAGPLLAGRRRRRPRSA